MSQQAFQLPAPNPNYPLLTRVISNPMLPGHGDEPLVWALGSSNPLDPSPTVIRRMFIQDGGVLVYFTGDGPQGAVCVTNFIPMQLVRLVEETMSPDVFVEEMAASEAREQEDDDDDDDDEGGEEPAPAVNANVAASS